MGEPGHRPVRLAQWDLATLEALAIEILGDLVRLDTTNPPGNEIIAARYLERRLESVGISGEVLEPSPDRGSIVARLGSGTDRGRQDGLLLLSHLDVVGVEPDEWEVPPFSGEIRDGMLWGRGTLDTKGLTAMQAAVMMTLKRLGISLERDLVLAATADEEAGGRWGAKWLTDHRLDLLESSAAINEGGGMGVRLGRHTFYLVQTAERATCPVTVTAKGQPGHASMPVADNAVVSLSRALVAIGSSRLPVHITGTFAQFVTALAARFGGTYAVMARQFLRPSLVDGVIERLSNDPAKTAAVRAMVRNTATPTLVDAGYKINVIPGQAQAQLDCRLLPGFGPDDLLAELGAVLDKAGLAGTVQLSAGPLNVPATESPADHELVALMRAAIAGHAGGAPLVPFLVPGATDGRHLRPKGIAVYGFSPMLPSEQGALPHAHNERISLDSLRFGTRVLWDVISAYCLAGAFDAG